MSGRMKWLERRNRKPSSRRLVIGLSAFWAWAAITLALEPVLRWVAELLWLLSIPALIVWLSWPEAPSRATTSRSLDADPVVETDGHFPRQQP